jgi:hypothetical protein
MTNNKITKYTTFNRSVYTEIVINAPIEKVWNELTNFEEMSTWNKSLQKIEGDFRKNGQTEVHFMDNKGIVGIYKHQLIHFEEGKLFGWSDPFIFGITDNHKYQLEKISQNQTKLIQSDEANGFATLFMGNFIMNFFLKSYTEFNLTLKNRLENNR